MLRGTRSDGGAHLVLKVHHQLFGFPGVSLKVVPATPSHKVPNDFPVILLCIVCDTSNYGGVVGELLQVACPGDVAEVRGVEFD